jgi:hypothetical protein
VNKTSQRWNATAGEIQVYLGLVEQRVLVVVLVTAEGVSSLTDERLATDSQQKGTDDAHLLRVRLLALRL